MQIRQKVDKLRIATSEYPINPETRPPKKPFDCQNTPIGHSGDGLIDLALHVHHMTGTVGMKMDPPTGNNPLLFDAEFDVQKK